MIARGRLILSLSVMLAALPVNAGSANHKVSDYLADGYTIAEKREEERTVPGKPPYDQVKRVVHVTTYRLERGAESVVCEVRYDSQLDTIKTFCQ